MFLQNSSTPNKITLLATNISPTFWHLWVDDFHFPQVGYVSCLEGSLMDLVTWMEFHGRYLDQTTEENRKGRPRCWASTGHSQFGSPQTFGSREALGSQIHPHCRWVKDIWDIWDKIFLLTLKNPARWQSWTLKLRKSEAWVKTGDVISQWVQVLQCVFEDAEGWNFTGKVQEKQHCRGEVLLSQTAIPRHLYLSKEV